MKNRVLTNANRTIRKSFPRFLSLLVMSMLGVFAFSGLKATAPDMIGTLDTYLDAHNTYDIKIVSDMGLTDEDVEAVLNLEGVEAAEGAYSRDILINVDDNESVINVASLLKDINIPELTAGRMPENGREMVVEANFISKTGYEIGDTLILDDDSLAYREMVIVGTVDSSLYFNNSKLSQNRGNTGIGTGTVNYYSFALPEAFDWDYYSCIYVLLEGCGIEITSSDEYAGIVSSFSDLIDGIKEAREDARYTYIYNKTYDEIDEVASDSYAELNEKRNELLDAKAELDEAAAELVEASGELQKAADELAEAKAELDDKRASLDKARAELSAVKKELDEASLKINAMLANPEITEVEKAAVTAYKTAYEQKLAAYNAGLTQYKSGLSQYEAGLKKYNEGLSEYDKNLADYNRGMEDYDEGLSEYNDNLDKLSEAQEEIFEEVSDALDELEKLKHPNWYVYDRTDYSTYSDYIDDSESIDNLAKVFPTVFYLVAILVSLISMNRMVEEDRLEIGTLKSLGFSNGKILTKYLIFSFLATVFGGLLGSALGLWIIPSMIFGIYKILFDVPDFTLGLNLESTIVGFAITVVCVCGSSIWTVFKVLREKPAALMRPKAPKNGKRVILENIKILWNNISFSKKVTIRNLFRYRKRVLVTVGGIAGCAALMLCGFGIRDAISDISESQFGGVFTYDGTAFINGDIEEERFAEIFAVDGIGNVTETERINARVNDISSYIFVFKDGKEAKDIIKFRDYETDESVELESGKVIITMKLSKLTGLAAGDKISILDVDNNAYEYEVSAVVTNYIEHYVFMDRDTYEQFGPGYKTNIVYFDADENADEELVTATLLENDEVMYVSFIARMIESVDNMLKSLNNVVLILIVLAAALAFVVLYNLSNININERKREIATLKVLGFYDREVDDYITKETILLTVIGIAFGLLFGFFLTRIVVSTVEIEKCRFIYHIKPLSYIYTALLSGLFTFLVNFITHFSLRKINMIDSLKSVE